MLHLSRLSRACLLFSLCRFVRSNGDGESPQPCRMYLAPSSLRDIPNLWGVYSGVSYNVGDFVDPSSLAIPMLDRADPNFNDVIGGFLMDSELVGGDAEARNVNMFLPNLGVLANYHPPLQNVIASGAQYDVGVHHTDPSAGAFTPYHGAGFVSTSHIAAGAEIFVGGEETIQDENYVTADSIIRSLLKFLDETTETDENLVLDAIMRVKRSLLPDSMSVIRRLIPESAEEIRRVAAVGVAKAQVVPRDLEWLKKNGKCLDNIHEAASTIPSAGRGAFTSRHIKKGNVITTSPLLPVMNLDFRIKNETNSKPSKKQQVLLNYCFGHPTSGWSFCPTTSAVLINHHAESPNAELRWSGDKSFLSEPIIRMLKETGSRISFDFVATRDLGPGEEIFIDYGPEWEDAWNKHVAEWEVPADMENYVLPSIMDRDHSVLSTDPNDYPHHSFLCRRDIHSKDYTDDVESGGEVNKPAGTDGDTHLWYQHNKYRWWWPCSVTQSNEDGTGYTVDIFEKSSRFSDMPKTISTVHDLPRSDIRFVDTPYRSQLQMSSAFRHVIPIPETLFPPHWRSTYRSGQDLYVPNWSTTPKLRSITGQDITKEMEKRVLKLDDRDVEKELRGCRCGLYLAPSTIVGGGNGVFLGVGLPKAMDIGPRLPINVVYNTGGLDQPHGNYQWDSGNFYAEYEHSVSSTPAVLAAGVGMMSNFHPGLVNARSREVTVKSILDKYRDPGAGAFSDYYNFGFQTTRPLKVGEEVFISYGESWFEERGPLVDVPLYHHYKEADNMAASLLSMVSEGLSEAGVLIMLGVIKKYFLSDKRIVMVLDRIKSMADLEKINTLKGTAGYESKSLEWLEENGSCIDHVYVKKSTLPQAGRGGFAKRPLEKGETVIPMPMLHSRGGRGAMRRMPAPKLPEGGTSDPEDVPDKQQFYNYQFGHAESSIMLFPVNAAIAINHSNQPNAELRWSPTDKKTQHFLSGSLDALNKEEHASVMLELVATKDIGEDEEIFFDYGPAWEKAWYSHLNNWKPPPNTGGIEVATSSLTISEMNKDKFNETYWEWSDDHFTACEQDGITEVEIFDVDDGSDYEGITKKHPGFHLIGSADWRLPCQIVGGGTNVDTFDIVFFTKKVRKKKKGVRLRVEIVDNLPASKVTFVSLPGRSDQHIPNRFTHEIRISDSIFPENWKDLNK